MKNTEHLRELKSPLFWKSIFSEFIATTLYSFMANSLCATSEIKTLNNSDCAHARNSSGMLLAATGIGLAVAILSYIFRTEYGCYMNPAISFGQFTCWRLSFVKTFMLLLMQMSGGIAGVALSYCIREDNRDSYLGIPHYNMTSTQGVIGQFIPAFIIVMTVLVSSDDRRREKNSIASMLYGIVSILAVLIAGQHSECAINPARILGSAIILNRWSHPIWIYWVGSVTGGIFAGLIYQLLFRHQHQKDMSQMYPRYENLSQIRASWLLNASQRHDHPLPTLTQDGVQNTSRNSKRKWSAPSFWKTGDEGVPFMNDDALTKSTIL